MMMDVLFLVRQFLKSIQLVFSRPRDHEFKQKSLELSAGLEQVPGLRDAWFSDEGAAVSLPLQEMVAFKNAQCAAHDRSADAEMLCNRFFQNLGARLECAFANGGGQRRADALRNVVVVISILRRPVGAGIALAL